MPPTSREIRSAERRVGHLVVLQPPGANPEVVGALEDALALARSGHLVGVAIAAATSDRCEATLYARGDASISTLVSATLRLQGRLLVHEE